MRPFLPLPVVSLLYNLVPCTLCPRASLQLMFTKESFLSPGRNPVRTTATVVIWPQNHWRDEAINITYAHPSFPEASVMSHTTYGGGGLAHLMCTAACKCNLMNSLLVNLNQFKCLLQLHRSSHVFVIQRCPRFSFATSCDIWKDCCRLHALFFPIHCGSARRTWIDLVALPTKGLLLVCRPPSGRVIGQFLSLLSHVTPADWLMLSPKSADGQNEAWIHGLIKCNANPSHHLTNSHWAGRWNHSGSHVAAPVKPFHLRGSDCSCDCCSSRTRGCVGRREVELYCCWVNRGLWLVLSPSL